MTSPTPLRSDLLDRVRARPGRTALELARHRRDRVGDVYRALLRLTVAGVLRRHRKTIQHRFFPRKRGLPMNTWQITQEDGNGWTVYRFVVRHDDGVMMLSQSYGSPAEVQAGLVEYAGRHDLDVDWGSASARRGRLVPR